MIKTALLVIFKLFYLRLKKTQREKILLIAEYGKSGGARTYFISLLNFLKRHEFDVTILKMSKEGDNEIDSLIKSLDFKTISSNFDFWCIDLDSLNPSLSKKKMIAYQLREMKFWCKLLSENNFSSILFSVSYPEQFLYAFLLPVNLKYILHTQPLKNADKYKKWILKYFLGSKKQIITVSESSRNAIESFWLNSKKSKYIKIVYNYYEPKYKNVVFYNSGDIKRVLTIGAVEEYKNPFFFIECAKQILIQQGNENLVFVWAGEGTLLDECRKRVMDYPNIQFVGNQDNVEHLYAQSSVYFQPSLQESHGIAVLGAMCHGLPCVVSDKGGLRESVIDHVSGFVTRIDHIEYSVQNLITILQDEKLLKFMGKNGIEIYKEKFNSEKWESAMDKIFHDF